MTLFVQCHSMQDTSSHTSGQKRDRFLSLAVDGPSRNPKHSTTWGSQQTVPMPSGFVSHASTQGSPSSSLHLFSSRAWSRPCGFHLQSIAQHTFIISASFSLVSPPPSPPPGSDVIINPPCSNYILRRRTLFQYLGFLVQVFLSTRHHCYNTRYRSLSHVFFFFFFVLFCFYRDF